MAGKYLTAFRAFLQRRGWDRRGFQQCATPVAAIFVGAACHALAADPAAAPASFLGSQSCASSSCHGGAATNRNQFTIWSKYDFHHARPLATLETARSARMAEALQISNPAQDSRCTACHAPLQTIPGGQLGKDVRVTEGVSCENCHGPAEQWIRSHTRSDWNTANRVQAGMRDLRNLYVRANACVACHQNVEPAIRRAGHPELIFELDGQSATEPRHWPKSADGPQAWLVGQAVALREMAWQRAQESSPEPELRERSEAVLWLLQRASRVANAGRFTALSPSDGPKRIQDEADEFAKAASQHAWAKDDTRRCLEALAAAAEDFADKGTSQPAQARRAERLVLALDRLTAGNNAAAHHPELNRALNQLFEDVQSLPDFEPARFAKDLNEFRTRITDVSR